VVGWRPSSFPLPRSPARFRGVRRRAALPVPPRCRRGSWVGVQLPPRACGRPERRQEIAGDKKRRREEESQLIRCGRSGLRVHAGCRRRPTYWLRADAENMRAPASCPTCSLTWTNPNPYTLASAVRFYGGCSSSNTRLAAAVGGTQHPASGTLPRWRPSLARGRRSLLLEPAYLWVAST
jgi:hypothetical protein